MLTFLGNNFEQFQTYRKVTTMVQRIPVYLHLEVLYVSLTAVLAWACVPTSSLDTHTHTRVHTNTHTACFQSFTREF